MIMSECCQKSIDTMKHIPMGLTPIVRNRTVMDWFFELKTSNHQFAVPSVILKKQTKLPQIFEVHLDFKKACVEFIDTNMGNISVTLQQFLSDTVENLLGVEIYTGAICGVL
eukprot:9393564-Ditylum_brightwellii.AAC.1